MCPFQLNTSMSFTKGDHLKLSSFQSTHLGFILMDPITTMPKVGVEEVSLERCIGPAQVIDLSSQLSGGERLH